MVNLTGDWMLVIESMLNILLASLAIIILIIRWKSRDYISLTLVISKISVLLITVIFYTVLVYDEIIYDFITVEQNYFVARPISRLLVMCFTMLILIDAIVRRKHKNEL
jgi:hypothetical protein